MGPDLEREVLGVNPESVEPQRLQDRVALQTLESSIDVVAGEREQVADVKSFGGRVREHHEGVKRPHAPVDVRRVRPTGLPALLPLSLDGAGVVAPRLGGRGWFQWFCHELRSYSGI